MATFILSADPAKPSYAGGFSVVLDLTGKPDPMPRKMIEAKTVADALAALEAYKIEAQETGMALAVSVRIKVGDRAPNGWKTAKAAMPFYHRVNV